MFFIFVFICFGLFTDNVIGSHWRYNEEDHWSPLCKTGSKQSPVALSKSIATIKELHSFILSGYGQIGTAVLKNNGHSAEVRLQNSEPPNIRGGELPGTYKLDHLHFHWQSEHTMENYRFPLELHLVHYNEQYGNLTNAAQHRYGIAVLGVLFDLSPDDDEDFQPLIEIIDNLKESKSEPRQLPGFIVKSFLPRNKAGFYRYEGSLTTPECNEGVIWTLFTSTLPVSKKQVKIFETLQTHEQIPLIKNYRSLQDLNGRNVYLRVSPIRSNAELFQGTLLSVIVAIILFLV